MGSKLEDPALSPAQESLFKVDLIRWLPQKLNIKLS